MFDPQETVMKSMCLRFLRDQSGATAIEYGLLGVQLTGTFTTVSTQLATAGK
jgi:Flp pilus assembly pilin Flp